MDSKDNDAEEDSTIPDFKDTGVYVLPEYTDSAFGKVIQTYRDLFRNTPGKTTLAQHYILTSGQALRVPPRRIPAEYRDEVDHMIKEMLDEGIIEESSSPWMAPAVYVRKKDGSIRLCVDYRALNKQTVKDAYPLPLPDEVQDHLVGSTIYSTLDLQSGYWQIPVHPTDCEKNAFCPGPGLRLFQFRQMPFGLSGAAGSFQCLMNKVFRGLNFVKVYVDDVFIYSGTKDDHIKHLTAVFQRLKDAGLSLRGNKCHIGLSQVRYLGHLKE